MRRASLPAFGAVWLLVAGWSCRESPRLAPVPVPSPRVGGTLRLMLTEPTTLDPAVSEDSYEGLVIGQVFEGLVDLDSNLNVVPVLARSWIVDERGLVYRFVMREGARFHNGREVTAEDVAWSFVRAARVPGGLAQAHLAHVVGARDLIEGRSDTILGIRVGSRAELTITLEDAYQPFLATLASTALRVVPREAIEAEGSDFARHPVGSGPFQLTEWTPGRRIVLSANRDHWLRRPFLDRVELDVTPGHDDQAFDSFLRGETDIAAFGRADRSRLPKGTSVVERLQMAVTFLGLNLESPPFDDPRVRRAAALSLDREAIVNGGGRLAVPARWIVPPGMVGGPPRVLAPSRDVDEARKVLEGAGYPGGRGLAVAELWANGTSPPTRGSAQVLAANLESVGIRTRLHSVSWPEMVKAVDSGKVPAYFLTWVADTPDRDSFLGVLFHSRGGNNYLHYADSIVDELLGEARRDPDPIHRMRLYDEIEARVSAANVLIPLYSEQSAYALRPGLQGVAVDPMGQITFSRVYWERPVASPLR